MKYYSDSNNVDKYIQMCKGYNGSNLYQELSKHLSKGSTLLELGCGPGNDLSYLKTQYVVTGSDLSDEFLIRCKAKFPEINLLHVDALTLEFEGEFDCIYSNKVLHHLNKEELDKSLNEQSKHLTPHGIVAHTFWVGKEDQTIDDMLFTYYQEKLLVDLVSKRYDILSTLSYKEFEISDSLFVIAKKK